MNTSPTTPTTTDSTPAAQPIPQAILWASAFLLAATVIMKAGSLPEHPAWADMASGAGGAGYTLVTADGGLGGDTNPDEILYVLDGRGEMLFAYEVSDAKDRRVTLLGSNSLPGLFNLARPR